MDGLCLDHWLPCRLGGPLDIALLPLGDVSPAALLGLPDWFAHLAQRRRAVRRFTWGDDAAAGHVLELMWDPAGPDAVLTATADGRARLRWRDGVAAVQLCRALASVELPAGMQEIVWQGDGIKAVCASGESIAAQVPRQQEASAGTMPQDLLELIPGQGGILSGMAPDDGMSTAFVLAYTAYAVRVAVSLAAPLPSPLLGAPQGLGNSPALSPDGETMAWDADGRLRVSAGDGGVRLLAALAALPTYPERPLCWHRSAPPATADGILYEGSWEIPWEGERLLGSLDRMLGQGLRVARVEIYASETLAVRQDLAAHARLRLGGRGVDIQVRSAYKQAYHWAVEEVLPELRLAAPGHLTFRVPRHPLQRDLIGDTCSWVAGLAPADEVMRRELGLEAAAVDIALHDGVDYVITAQGRTGAKILEAHLSPLHRRIPYKEVYPGRAAIVETGGLRVYTADGCLLKEELVETDAEAAFAACTQGIAALRPILESGTGLPLFGRLEATVSLSEPDEDLPVPWERFSPAEELHEEIYFGALAALEPLTKARGSGHLRAPGSVVPRIAVATAAPTRLTLRVTPPGERLRPEPPRPLRLGAISLRGGTLIAVPADPPAAGWVLPEGQLPLGLEVEGVPRTAAPMSSPLDLECAYDPDLAWPMACVAAKRAGGLAWVEGFSYMGRAIPAIAIFPGLEALTISPPRLSERVPTLLLVAGHHANETSSTLSALRFALEASEAGAGALALIVPMENPDGAALHRVLARQSPRWKLHAARFNALGHEFGRDADDSPFGEAHVRPRLLSEFAVDVLVDDHGVPGHEWAQPFSGRSSPPLFPVAYTYPSGIFYGIGPGAEGDEAPAEEFRPVWERVVAELALDPALREAQALLWDRYERYGQSLCPERYPSRRSLGWPFQSARRATQRVSGAGLLEFVTEVADEGAAPEQFELCVKAHLYADRAVFATLAGSGAKRGRLAGRPST